MDKETRETFWKAFASSPVIMMRLEGADGHAEPMSAQLDKNAHHAIWFFTKRDNRIAPGGPAMGQVMTRDHGVFACIKGTLSEETDQSVREAHWNNAVEAWLPGGKTDPNVVMLRYDITDSEVWASDIGITGAFKMLTGKPIDREHAGTHELGAV
ncbi:pyridoxamine 5'-phosphate oxidase family protein [Novosphingobium colocasiae]|uniref:pyridoxamine 5'-phosphate oxidase family protein n=1 Tax=Novosphingobium colocasiae TaxID=1256513 RepID=UPI0035B2D181